LVIKGARENNLRGETVRIPRGVLVGVCGVSGSGQSTLLIDTLGRALVRRAHSSSFAREPMDPGAHDTIEGAPQRALLVDQARTGIHSPAAFLGLTKPLLKLYAASEDAQALGLDEKKLSRPCSACKGHGLHRIEMGFLPDVRVACETCQGTGFSPEAWHVRLGGVALPEINAMTIDEVCDLFPDEIKITRPLKVARDVGLGYLVWRQPSFTLSGGEVQRLKIVKELAAFAGAAAGRKVEKETLYILDEPTLGQHMEDVVRLIQVLHRLVAAGHTVIIVEHHPSVLVACDWLIELGPGGGPDGGRVIATGTPEDVAASGSPTAPYLREALGVARSKDRPQKKSGDRAQKWASQ
jgi:excinuclease ABC subunit A